MYRTNSAQTRQIEAFGRTLNATASHLIGGDASQHYHNALGEIHRELRRPIMQRSVFALAKANPRELVRSTFSSTEIQQRALAHLPDDILRNIPDTLNSYSLFQGFEASRPEDDHRRKKKHSRHGSRSQKMLEDNKDSPQRHPGLSRLKSKKGSLDHRLEMMEVRKNMCASEIVELDKKMASLAAMRKRVVERLAGLEQEETDLELEIAEVASKLEDMQEEVNANEVRNLSTPPSAPTGDGANGANESPVVDEGSFMSQSIYEKLSSPKTKKRRTPRRISMPILHEHLEPGTRIKEFQAHNDIITAMDFDVPFGTLVTAALDDTLRVWNLNTGRCTGLLEGHISSVRCIQVEDSIVASGANDATVRLWDLSQAEYTPTQSSTITRAPTVNTDDPTENDDDLFPDAPANLGATQDRLPSSASMADCPMFTLSSHVAEVTALHFQGQTLVSGSSDKTLRQWDLNTGRCVQTLDVLWAAAQATSTAGSAFPSPSPSFEQSEWFRPTVGRAQTAAVEADFVGALQIFQSAVACGTADSVVRLWDLRSGAVQRQLIGHTGGVTALQFDDVHLVTGSMDRSIRVSAFVPSSPLRCVGR